jgi:hypothetical protein
MAEKNRASDFLAGLVLLFAVHVAPGSPLYLTSPIWNRLRNRSNSAPRSNGMPPRMPPVASGPFLGADVALLEISNQSIDAAEFEIAPVDQSYLFGRAFHNGENLKIL